jgi:hypothetical protein
MMNILYSKLLVMCMFVSALCIGGNNTYENKIKTIKTHRPIQLRRNELTECAGVCTHFKKPLLLNVTKTKSL